MKILISFCNTPGPNYVKEKNISPLAVLDTEKNKIAWIKLPLDQYFIGLTGISENENYFFVGYQSTKPGIFIINKKKLSVRLQRLPDVSDPHSVVYRQGYIYIASTGTDSVVRYKLEKTRLVNPQVVWHAPQSKQTQDTHHINCLCFSSEGLLVSGFGLRESKFHTSAKNGYIYNVDQKKFISQPIPHPHTIVEYEGKIYYCASIDKSVNIPGKKILKLKNGYTRGLVVTKNIVIVGTSSARKKSRSTGVELHPNDIIIPSCRIYSLNPDKAFSFLKIKSYDFSDNFNEIYDLHQINSNLPQLKWETLVLHGSSWREIETKYLLKNLLIPLRT